ncbi:MAG: hypothetical protein ACRCS3_11610 [Paracoccaceae bacterium]
MEPDTEAFFARFRQRLTDRESSYLVLASEASSQRLFLAELEWGGLLRPTLKIAFYRADPRFGTAPAQYIEMIRITTARQRPQHLSFGPTLYRMFDHPLDRTRHGIGWMGWLPFSLTPADVPEAAVVMPMNGGTFIPQPSIRLQPRNTHPRQKRP